MVVRKAKGTIQRGLFVGGVGLQRYAPGQNCSRRILVHGAKCIRLCFEKVALGHDDKDYVTVANDHAVIKQTSTGFGENIPEVKIAGSEVIMRFASSMVVQALTQVQLDSSCITKQVTVSM